MKKALRYIILVSAVLLLAVAYHYRAHVLYPFSDLVEAKNLYQSSYAKGYFSAAECHVWFGAKTRMKVRWDLWCVDMRAEIAPPRMTPEFLFFRVRATDRTDTEFIYVFDRKGQLIEVAYIPLA